MEDDDEEDEEEEAAGLDAGAVELEDGGREEGGREEERRGAAREAEARGDGSPAWARACTKEAHDDFVHTGSIPMSLLRSEPSKT